jgi:transglutaminase-like putative cysteine protease
MNNVKLAIRHETIYRYSTPVGYTIQQLRLTPRAEPRQHVLSWQIAANGGRRAFTDAYGNSSEMLTITTPHDEVRIVASGVVEVTAPDRGRLLDSSLLSPLAFTVATHLTEPGEQIRAFAARHIASGASTHALLALTEAIRGAVVYQSGATVVTTTAGDALTLGLGVCQDHAHLFLACCHTLKIPARYVSGYLDSGHAEHGASHAWVDVWVEEVDYSGWISLDVTHSCLQDAGYCRLAVGRDYESAAPVRGIRHGGSGESMAIQVDISSQ